MQQPPIVTRTAVVTIADDSMWPFAQVEFEAILAAFLEERFEGYPSSVVGVEAKGIAA